MKENFDKVLHEAHGGSKDSTPQPHWKEGVGRRIRQAVKDEDGEVSYDKTDDLPKHTGRTKQYGWETKDTNLNWKAMYRWLHGQVGRKMDDIRSDVAKNCTKDNYASRRLTKLVNACSRYENLCIPMRVEIRDEPYGPELKFVSLDGTHIFSRASKGDLYIDGKGILCEVPHKLVLQVQMLRKQATQDSSGSVTWIKNKAYFKLHGAWFELTLQKLDFNEYPKSPEGLPYHGTRRSEPCLLCAKLGKYWSYTYMDLFGCRVFCTGMRTLGRREINTLLLNVGA